MTNVKRPLHASTLQSGIDEGVAINGGGVGKILKVNKRGVAISREGWENCIFSCILW